MPQRPRRFYWADTHTHTIESFAVVPVLHPFLLQAASSPQIPLGAAMFERTVVLAVLLLARARLGSSTPGIDWSNDPLNDGVLSKTATSSKMRLVFALGLEGAGHAYGE